MSMFPHTVTLYITDKKTDSSTMNDVFVSYITVLEGVLMTAVKAKNVNATGLEGADSVTLYIPLNVKATDGVTGEPKEYMPPVEFWRQDDKSGIWTLSPGSSTFFVKGRVVHEDWDNQKISAAYDYVYDVTKVDFKDYGGSMRHWEVGGV